MQSARGPTHNVCNTGIGTATENNDANNKHQRVYNSQTQVALLVPLALLDELEPHPRGEVEGETRDEQAGADGEQVREERNGFRDDPGENCDDDDERKPRNPAHLGVDEADNAVLVVAAVDITSQNGRVDGAGDEDDGKCETESDLAEHGTGGQESGRLDGAANKHVNKSARDGVNEDLNETEGPDGLDEILGGVHLVHERELADGKGVGENDVTQSNEGLDKRQTLLGPGGPIRLGDCAVRLLDAGANDGDQNRNDDRSEIDVAQNGDLGKGRWNGQQHEDDGGGDSEDNRAGTVVGDVAEGDGSGQCVRADKEEQLETEHDADEFIAEFPHEQLTSVRVVGDVWELELDLADDVGRVDGDHANTDRENDTGNHAEIRKGGGNGQGAQCDGLDNQDDSKAFPAQSVELFVAIRRFPLLQVGPICNLADALVLTEHTRRRLRVAGADRLLSLVVARRRDVGRCYVEIGHFWLWFVVLNTNNSSGCRRRWLCRICTKT